MRIGIGFDVHRLESGRELWLGCVHFQEAPRGLSGHSDADVVAHAVCDALLGASGLGDIGDHFPPSDDRWKGFPGRGFLEAVAAMIRDAGWKIANVDCTVMCEAIHLGSRKAEMAAQIAGYLNVDPDVVNVKATTFEGHGAVGRGEVIACEAAALIQRL